MCPSLIPAIKWETLDSYALIATATDYDSWRPHSDSVTVADVFKTLQTNADISRHVAATILGDLVEAVSYDQGSQAVADILSEEVGCMKYAIMPRSDKQRAEDRKKLSFILPEYFPED
jgi:5'-methylthioadenosine phosphorylase